MPNHTTRPSPPRHPRYLTATALLAVVVLAGACSQGGQMSPGNFSVQSHLGQLPTAQEPSMLVAGDLDAASEIAGLPRPDDAASEEANAWLLALTLSTEYGVFVPTPAQLTQAFGHEGDDELGWDLTDVRTFAESQSPQQQQTLVVAGDFDDDTLAADLEDLDDGVYSAGSGPDGSVDVQQTTPLRPLGAPLRVARDGEVIMVDAEEQVVREWVTGAERETVADDDAVMDVAARLDDAGVYAAAIRTQVGPLQPPAAGDGAGQLFEMWQDWAITEPFEVFGAGWAMAEDEPVVMVAYRFTDPGSAARAVDQVQQVWTEGLTLTGQPVSDMFTVQEVEHDAEVVTAALHLGHDGAPRHIYDMIQRNEVTVGYLQP